MSSIFLLLYDEMVLCNSYAETGGGGESNGMGKVWCIENFYTWMQVMIFFLEILVLVLVLVLASMQQLHSSTY